MNCDLEGKYQLLFGMAEKKSVKISIRLPKPDMDSRKYGAWRVHR